MDFLIETEITSPMTLLNFNKYIDKPKVTKYF